MLPQLEREPLPPPPPLSGTGAPVLLFEIFTIQEIPLGTRKNALKVHLVIPGVEIVSYRRDSEGC